MSYNFKINECLDEFNFLTQKKKVLNLSPLHSAGLSSLKPSAREHEVSGVQRRCLHTLSSQRRVFGRGGIYSLQGLPSILLIKQWLCTQTHSRQGKCNTTWQEHQAFGHLGEEECQIMTPEWLWNHYSFCSRTPKRHEMKEKRVWCINVTLFYSDIGLILLRCVKINNIF